MKIQTLPIAAALRDGRWTDAVAPAGDLTATFGFTPSEIGELQAALAASASLDSWIEAQSTEPPRVIAPGTGDRRVAQGAPTSGQT